MRKWISIRVAVFMVMVSFALPAWAELGSLMVPSGGGGNAHDIPARTSNSLFFGATRTGLLAPYPKRNRAVVGVANNLSAVQRIRSFIGRAESPHKGYDAVQHGARIKPSKLPTQMTIGEIYQWIAATPGQPHAIGRYQFIPDTLRRVVNEIGADRSDLFSPKLQDQLADVLLSDAGMASFMAGRIDQGAFMNNLAAIWAGLPTTSGRSKYHGYAGNRATVSLADFHAQVAKMRPG